MAMINARYAKSRIKMPKGGILSHEYVLKGLYCGYVASRQIAIIPPKTRANGFLADAGWLLFAAAARIL
jgi:hypothetical protein